ncbi:bifunctional DNA primase/polymerase [Thalassobaculum sp.]|uniref:bifunctional DNA primase/polymerase n=1 Tax=Thalassobaculum sp. TaxID=2022740 RepID=UPI003B5C4757
MTATSVLDHALMFARLGLAVFPVSRPIHMGDRFVCGCGKPNCPSPGKHPDGRLAPHGFKDASSSPAALRAWFDGNASNIGIATGARSGIIVLDIDERHDGPSSLTALECQYGDLPPTWRFLTGGGGEHILFRHPRTVVRNSASAIKSGIDVRGDGGYIVAPPSLHISGRPYAISVDHHPDEVGLSDAPAWLMNLIRGGGGERGGSAIPGFWRESIRDSIPDGQRNQTLTQVAGHLIGKSVDPHVCLELLLSLNGQRCQPPLADDEVVRLLTSIVIRERRKRAGPLTGGPKDV